MELGRRQAVSAQQPAHRRLEDAVDRLAVELPVVERIAERRHAGTAAPTVAADGGSQRGRRRERSSTRRGRRRPGRRRGSSAPRSQSVRRMFVDRARAPARDGVRSSRSRGRCTARRRPSPGGSASAAARRRRLVVGPWRCPRAARPSGATPSRPDRPRARRRGSRWAGVARRPVQPGDAGVEQLDDGRRSIGAVPGSVRDAGPLRARAGDEPVVRRVRTCRVR